MVSHTRPSSGDAREKSLVMLPSAHAGHKASLVGEETFFPREGKCSTRSLLSIIAYLDQDPL